MGFGRVGSTTRRGGQQGQATQNEGDVHCGDNQNLRKGGVAAVTKMYACRNYQKRGTCSFGNDCKFSHDIEGNMKVELQEGGGFGRISPPHATGGFENRSSGFGGGGAYHQEQQQSKFGSYKAPSRFGSSQPLQNFQQGGGGGGGGGFGFGSDQPRSSPPFGNKTGFGLSSQRAQLNATPSSHGVGGSGGLPFGGRPTNARLNSDFNSSADSGFHHTGGLLSNYGTKGESAGYGIPMGSGHPSRPPPCRYWDKEGKSCYFGNNCKFSHVSGGNASERGRAYGGDGRIDNGESKTFKNDKMCNNWLRDGTCRFGDRCRFLHASPTAMKETIRPESEGIGNGSVGSSVFGSRGGDGFGQLSSRAGIPNGQQRIHRAQCDDGGAAGFGGGQVHFGNNIFGNGRMGEDVAMGDVKQFSATTDHGVFAKQQSHAVSIGTHGSMDMDMQPLDTTSSISIVPSFLTSSSQFFHLSGGFQSPTVSCNPPITALSRAKELEVDNIDLTEDEREAFLADVFTLGMIPEVPPPIQFCLT